VSMEVTPDSPVPGTYAAKSSTLLFPDSPPVGFTFRPRLVRTTWPGMTRSVGPYVIVSPSAAARSSQSVQSFNPKAGIRLPTYAAVRAALMISVSPRRQYPSYATCPPLLAFEDEGVQKVLCDESRVVGPRGDDRDAVHGDAATCDATPSHGGHPPLGVRGHVSHRRVHLRERAGQRHDHLRACLADDGARGPVDDATRGEHAGDVADAVRDPRRRDGPADVAQGVLH